MKKEITTFQFARHIIRTPLLMIFLGITLMCVSLGKNIDLVHMAIYVVIGIFVLIPICTPKFMPRRAFINMIPAIILILVLFFGSSFWIRVFLGITGFGGMTYFIYDSYIQYQSYLRLLPDVSNACNLRIMKVFMTSKCGREAYHGTVLLHAPSIHNEVLSKTQNNLGFQWYHFYPTSEKSLLQELLVKVFYSKKRRRKIKKI